MGAFLTDSELLDLTGYRIPAYQVKWLTKHGIRHWVNKAGRPAVPRSEIDGRNHTEHYEEFRLGQVT